MTYTCATVEVTSTTYREVKKLLEAASYHHAISEDGLDMTHLMLVEKPAVPVKKRRIFIDLDGPTVDFEGFMQQHNLTGDEVKALPGAYLAMKATAGALDAIRYLICRGYDVWIATKPPTGVVMAYADKALWVIENLPELKRKIIITHHKGMLGGEDDYLIDDRIHRASCDEFRGQILHYRDGFGWAEILEFFDKEWRRDQVSA